MAYAAPQAKKPADPWATPKVYAAPGAYRFWKRNADPYPPKVYAAPDVVVPVPVERKRNAEADPAVLYSGNYGSNYENVGSYYDQPAPIGSYNAGQVAQPYYNQGTYYPTGNPIIYRYRKRSAEQPMVVQALQPKGKKGPGYVKRDVDQYGPPPSAYKPTPKVYAAPGAYRFWKRNADPMDPHRPKVYAAPGTYPAPYRCFFGFCA